MKILQVCDDRGIPFSGTKGASIHLRSLAGAFLAEGHDVGVRVRRYSGAFDPEYVETFESADDLCDDIRRLKIDVVYERYSLGAVSGIEAARRSGIPFILEVNAPLVEEARMHRPDTLALRDPAIEQRLWKEADLVIAVSTPLAARIAGVRGTDAGIVVVPNGYDPALFEHARRREVQRHPERKRIVFIGHPKPWHGADRIPAIIARAVDEGADVECLMIGGGAQSDMILQAAKRAGVDTRLIRTGDVSHVDAAAWLQSAHIGIAPYPRIDDFYFCPIKIVEYLGAGLPIVTSAQGDIAALAGDAALYVDPDDVGAMAHAVATLAMDDAARERLGAEATRRASRFTWAAAAKAIIDAATQLGARHDAT